MSASLRKCVALGPKGGQVPLHLQDYRWQGTRYAAETNTPYVRIWADWPSLEPLDGQWNETIWAGLDAQIFQANYEGRLILVTPYRFPGWANDEGGPFRVPDNVGVGSPYHRFLDRLIFRWSPGNPNRPATVCGVEIMNEPNGQWNPQSVNGVPAWRKAATMIRLAQDIKAFYGWQSALPLILAPGTDDKRAPYDTGNPISWTEFRPFTDSLLNELRAQDANFVPQPCFVWSHHNYVDVEYDIRDSATGPPQIRSKLNAKSWYRGWQNPNGGDARIFLTEGGARFNKVNNLYFGTTDITRVEDKMRTLLLNNHSRMYTGTEGAGVDMLTQYLYTSDVGFDTGLRRPVPPATGSSLV